MQHLKKKIKKTMFIKIRFTSTIAIHTVIARGLSCKMEIRVHHRYNSKYQLKVRSIWVQHGYKYQLKGTGNVGTTQVQVSVSLLYLISVMLRA